MKGRAAALLLISLQGCSFPPGGPDAPSRPEVAPATRFSRESDMNRQWRLRRLSELQRALGAPVRVMAIPGGGNPPGFAVVYGRDPETGCIDAFALQEGDDPLITAYHCR